MATRKKSATGRKTKRSSKSKGSAAASKVVVSPADTESHHQHASSSDILDSSNHLSVNHATEGRDRTDSDRAGLNRNRTIARVAKSKVTSNGRRKSIGVLQVITPSGSLRERVNLKEMAIPEPEMATNYRASQIGTVKLDVVD